MPKPIPVNNIPYDDIPSECPGCSFHSVYAEDMISHWIRCGIFKTNGNSISLSNVSKPHVDTHTIIVEEQHSLEQRPKIYYYEIKNDLPNWIIAMHMLLLGLFGISALIVGMLAAFILWIPIVQGPLRLLYPYASVLVVLGCVLAALSGRFRVLVWTTARKAPVWVLAALLASGLAIWMLLAR